MGDIIEYNKTNKNINKKFEVPCDLYKYVFAAIGDKLYGAPDMYEQGRLDILEYDPTTSKWTIQTQLPGYRWGFEYINYCKRNGRLLGRSVFLYEYNKNQHPNIYKYTV